MTAPIRLTPDPRAYEPDPAGTRGPESALGKRARELSALKQEIDAWHARGGKLGDDPNAVGGIPMPGGVYGGEFSDDEMAAYQSATQRYAQMLAEHLREVQLNRTANAASALATTPGDATRVAPRNRGVEAAIDQGAADMGDSITRRAKRITRRP